MANETEKALLADLMDAVRSGVEQIRRAQDEQANLTATAYAAARRVRVTVNAHGAVIETRLSPGAEDLDRAALARAFTAAARDAAAQVHSRAEEVIEQLRRDQARLPRLSEFIPGMPDVQDMMPKPPQVPTAPPRPASGDEPDGSMRFADALPDGVAEQQSATNRTATESSW